MSFFIYREDGSDDDVTITNDMAPPKPKKTKLTPRESPSNFSIKIPATTPSVTATPKQARPRINLGPLERDKHLVPAGVKLMGVGIKLHDCQDYNPTQKAFLKLCERVAEYTEDADVADLAAGATSSLKLVDVKYTGTAFPSRR